MMPPKVTSLFAIYLVLQRFLFFNVNKVT